MAHQFVSKKRAQSLFIALILVGFGINSITNNWWPQVMVTIGIALTIKQLLLGRIYEAIISFVIFIGVYAFYQFDLAPVVLGPVLLFTSAIFILIREYFDNKTESEAQKEEDVNHELEEKKEDEA